MSDYHAQAAQLVTEWDMQIDASLIDLENIVAAALRAEAERATMAERERCAHIAQHFSDWRQPYAYDGSTSAIGHRERINEGLEICAVIRAAAPEAKP